MDEMMVKFYGRSVVRQYIPAKPHKYGVELWAICCSCCGYSLTQNLYLGGSVIPEGGRDVILEFTEPYYDKGHVIYCDRFFTHLDLAAYLRTRSTGFIGTANTQTLPRSPTLSQRHAPTHLGLQVVQSQSEIRNQKEKGCPSTNLAS